MAEHTYNPGDVVSVRTRLVRDDEPGFGFPGTSPQFTFRDIEPEYARWLSDEDQDSLLKVVRAARKASDWLDNLYRLMLTVDPLWERGRPATEIVKTSRVLGAALAELPEPIAVRLSEGGG